MDPISKGYPTSSIFCDELAMMERYWSIGVFPLKENTIRVTFKCNEARARGDWEEAKSSYTTQNYHI